MFHKKPTDKQIIGKIGEDFACHYLINLGYKIIDRNYLKKWGEIDIVSRKLNFIHFVEVKTVSRDTYSKNIIENSENVSYETLPLEEGLMGRTGSVWNRNDDYRPEDNIHPWKLQRMGRVIQSYLLDKDVSDETEWQFDVITVYLDKDKRLVKIEMLDDLVL